MDLAWFAFISNWLIKLFSKLFFFSGQGCDGQVREAKTDTKREISERLRNLASEGGREKKKRRGRAKEEKGSWSSFRFRFTVSISGNSVFNVERFFQAKEEARRREEVARYNDEQKKAVALQR